MVDGMAQRSRIAVGGNGSLLESPMMTWCNAKKPGHPEVGQGATVARSFVGAWIFANLAFQALQ